MKNLFLFLFTFFCVFAMSAQVDLDKNSKFKPKASSWKDSYSANGFCWCDSNFDHGIDKKTAQINGKNFGIKDICNELKKHPNYRKWKNGDPRYNDIQCGNGPQNTAPDEPACPGRVDLKYCDRGSGPELWDMAWLATREKFKGNGTTPPPPPTTDPNKEANESVKLAQEYTGNGGSGNNEGPRARLLAPSTGVFTAPANFKIELEATDSDGIDRVEIEVINGTSKQTDKTAPYEVDVTGLAEGRYFVQILAFDTKGNETDVDFFVQVNKGTGNTNNAPSISFAKPSSNATFKAPASFDVTVNASDSDGSVSNVRLSIDDKFIRQENVAPYTWTTALDAALTNLSAGTYTLKAEATDNKGKKALTSMKVTVTGNGTPPTPPTPPIPPTTGDCKLPKTLNTITVNKETVNYSSGPIDISCVANATISMSMEGVGPMENSDYLNAYYKIDGGAEIAISENKDAFALKTVSSNGIQGKSVEIIIKGFTSFGDETYTVSNIRIEAGSGTNSTPTTTPTDSNNDSSIVFTKPKNNQKFSTSDDVVVNVTTANNDNVAKVELYMNDNLVRQELHASYDWGHTSSLDPVLKNMEAGTYTLKAVVTDKSGKSSENAIQITVSGTGNKSVTETISSFSTYPNPVSFQDVLAIQVGLSNDSPAVIQLLDMTGKVIAKRSFENLKAGSNYIELKDIQNTVTASGVYLLSFKSGLQTETATLIFE